MNILKIALLIAILAPAFAHAQRCAPIVNVEQLGDEAHVEVQTESVAGGQRVSLRGAIIGNETIEVCRIADPGDLCCTQTAVNAMTCELPDVAGSTRFIAIRGGRSRETVEEALCRQSTYVDLE